MAKIKFITDSASDIPNELSAEHDIRVLGFQITAGGKSFRDGDIPPMEYYDLIDSSPDLPVHSQLTVFEFEEIYEEYANEGYEDIFFISINAHGSATYQNACLARDNFKQSHPEYKGNIRVLDSTSYSGTYGYTVIEAAKMAKNGKSADEIEKWLLEWYDCCEVYLAAFTLRYAKKSGRISAAAAFAGELLGFKPIILLKGEGTKTVAKPRGDSSVLPKLADVVCGRIKKDAPYVIIYGRSKEQGEETAKLLTERLGYPPVETRFQIGGAIASNSGPDMVAVGFMAKKE